MGTIDLTVIKMQMGYSSVSERGAYAPPGGQFDS